MKFSILIIFSLIVAYTTSYWVETNEMPICYGNICPMETIRCKKLLKPTNYGTLRRTVTCLDPFGRMVKEYYFENPVAFKLNSRAESISYSDVGKNPITPEYNEIADLMEWNNAK